MIVRSAQDQVCLGWVCWSVSLNRQAHSCSAVLGPSLLESGLLDCFSNSGHSSRVCLARVRSAGLFIGQGHGYTAVQLTQDGLLTVW